MEHMVDVTGHLMDDMPCVLSRTSVKEAADDVDRMALTGFAVEAVKKKAQCGISTGDTCGCTVSHTTGWGDRRGCTHRSSLHWDKTFTRCRE
jgi:hypothetical protein